jgi:hypothetical protein
MNPERLAEPRALAALFIALVIVAAVLVFTVGARAPDKARNEERPA